MGDEVPSWFYDNGWHEFVNIALSDAHTPQGSGRCEPSSCLTVRRGSLGADGQGSERPSSAVQAVVMGAGLALKGQDRRSRRALHDYFEGANAIPSDDQFELGARRSLRGERRRSANDDLVVICASGVSNGNHNCQDDDR